MMNYREEVERIIKTYKLGMVTFEECCIQCIEVLNKLKQYYLNYISLFNNHTLLMNKARIYVLTELIKALTDRI